MNFSYRNIFFAFYLFANIAFVCMMLRVIATTMVSTATAKTNTTTITTIIVKIIVVETVAIIMLVLCLIPQHRLSRIVKLLIESNPIFFHNCHLDTHNNAKDHILHLFFCKEVPLSNYNQVKISLYKAKDL